MRIEILRAIQRQKIEWGKKGQARFIEREAMSFALKNLSSSLIKVIVGPRRAGKSVFAWLLLKGRSSAYVNFDEPIFSGTSVDVDEILAAIKIAYGETEFLFLDEIQNVDNWQLVLNRLQREGHNIVVTGSNAKLLSGELATHLTGRHVPIEILPFNFREFVTARKSLLPDLSDVDLPGLASEYLRVGGFPEIVLAQGVDREAYLGTLVEAVISKDIVQRYRLRGSKELSGLADWVFSNVAAEVSFHRLTSGNGSAQDELLADLPTSHLTVKKYLGYLEDAYLISLVTRFSRSSGERLRSPKKVYAVDNGVATAFGFRLSPDNGKLLENLVCSELLKAGYKPGSRLFYHRSVSDKQADFVLRDDTGTSRVLQVCWDMSHQKTQKREIDAMEDVLREAPGAVPLFITWDEERVVDVAGKKAEVVPFWKWATATK